MTKTTTNLLCIAIACLVAGLAFVTGIVNAQNLVALYVALPLGAVFLGLFLIFRILEKETSLYDHEQHSHPALKQATAPMNEQEATCGCGCAPHPRETSSAAH